MEANWVKIHVAESAFKAELIIGMLEQNSIQAVVLNKQDSAYLLGQVEIYARKTDALKAAHLIKSEGAAE